jgi:catechol 2,3-dioxygenase-like lactoylglutathione lyase family enzyme
VARAAAFIDHVTIEVVDYEASRAFYQRALAPLHVTHNEVTSPDSGLPEAVFGPPGAEDFIITPGQPAAAIHVAFVAPDRATVDAFHAAAVAAGGVDNGAPGVRVKYHPNYYGAFVFDPDGNNVEAVCHEAPE